MKTVLHMSDPHFGTERPKVVEALERLAHRHAPHLVILSGDITQRARTEEFAAARAFMTRLGAAESLVIPGNHDIPLFAVLTRLFLPYHRYAKAFGSDLEPVHETSDLLVIGLRTTRRYRHIEGEVSQAQIDRVAQRLKQARPGQLRVVVTHQPVHVQDAEDEEHLLRGRHKALPAWSAAGVDLILGGHIHRPFITTLQASASGHNTVWVAQAGTSVSSRIRHDAGNSVNLICHGFEGKPRECVVERWDYDDADGEFVLMESKTLP